MLNSLAAVFLQNSSFTWMCILRFFLLLLTFCFLFPLPKESCIRACNRCHLSMCVCQHLAPFFFFFFEIDVCGETLYAWQSLSIWFLCPGADTCIPAPLLFHSPLPTPRFTSSLPFALSLSLSLEHLWRPVFVFTFFFFFSLFTINIFATFTTQTNAHPHCFSLHSCFFFFFLLAPVFS